MGRNDDVVTSGRNRIFDTVEAISSACVRGRRTQRLTIRTLQCHIHARHTAVVRHEYLTADLAVFRTPTNYRLGVIRMFAVAVIHRSNRIFIPLQRLRGDIEETVLQTGIECVSNLAAVLLHAGQDIFIHRHSRW